MYYTLVHPLTNKSIFYRIDVINDGFIVTCKYKGKNIKANYSNYANIGVTINDTDLVHTDGTNKIAATFDFNATPTLSGTGSADLLIGGTAKVADAVTANNFIAGTYQAAVNVDVVYQ